jgi:hypothetical protein
MIEHFFVHTPVVARLRGGPLGPYLDDEGVSKLLIRYPLLRTSATSFVGGTMITQVLHCPYCHGTDIVRHGLSPEGKQRYRCRACLEGRGRTFLLEYS